MESTPGDSVQVAYDIYGAALETMGKGKVRNWGKESGS